MSAATEHVNIRLQVALPNRTSRRRNTMKRESIVVIVNAIIWGLFWSPARLRWKVRELSKRYSISLAEALRPRCWWLVPEFGESHRTNLRPHHFALCARCELCSQRSSRQLNIDNSEFLRNSEMSGMFEGGKPPSRVTAKQSACPAREQAPFCVFRTGRQDCGAPEGRETLWRS